MFIVANIYRCEVQASVLTPSVYDSMAMYWTKDNPFDVGNAARFQNGFTSLPLQPFFDKTALKCCSNRAAAECSEFVKANPSVSPGCLARLLTTDYQLRTDGQVMDAMTASPAMTIEGWVQINSPQGGVVLSTGRAAGRATCAKKGSCQVALIYIKVNATHVTVGHETALDDAGTTWTLNTVAFAISSSAALLEQLGDENFYLGSNGDTSLVGKFVHVTVVRKSLVGPSHLDDVHLREYWFSTYKVYVNGCVSALCSPPSSTLLVRGFLFCLYCTASRSREFSCEKLGCFMVYTITVVFWITYVSWREYVLRSCSAAAIASAAAVKRMQRPCAHTAVRWSPCVVSEWHVLTWQVHVGGGQFPFLWGGRHVCEWQALWWLC